jgi:hypothetical protein
MLIASESWEGVNKQTGDISPEVQPDISLFHLSNEYPSHSYQHVYDIREMLILPLANVGSSKILRSGFCSLTSIKRDWTR